MTITISEIASDPWERRDEMLPVLSDAQLSRVESYGIKLRTQRGEILLDYGQEAASPFVVFSGEVEVVRPDARRRKERLRGVAELR
jgi:CRP-like cAMP-binding protein